MNIVSIDSGFGYMKALVNGKQVKFANLTGNYRLSDNGVIGSSRDLSIIVDGLGSWNFGQTAVLQSSTYGRRQSSDRIFTNEFLAGLLLAISEGYSKNTDRIEVDVITGLPGSEYNRDKAYKDSFRKFIVGDYHIQRPGYNQRITIKSLRFTQQAWGAIWRHLIDDKGNPVKPDIKADIAQIGCINVGYRTVEIGTVEVSGIQSGNLRVQTAAGIELSEPDGTHRLIHSLVNNLSQALHQPIKAEQAIEILENGGLILNGDWLDYQLQDDTKFNFNSIIYSHMTKVYDNGTAFLYRLILTGGGANVVDSFSHIPQLVVSETPQWDTVEGYSRLAKLVAKRGK